MKSGEIRIIAGKWRHRKIVFPALLGLRPTTNLIRETVFNWLAPFICDARCLDLFAGSGALGFEALSRGARSVIFFDKHPKVIQAIKKQLQDFAEPLSQAYCVRIPLSLDLKLKQTPFDIIFIDPPFHEGHIEKITNWLEQEGILAPEALIYIEAEAHLSPLPVPSHWKILRSKIRGQVGYHLLRRELPISISSNS